MNRWVNLPVLLKNMEEAIAAEKCWKCGCQKNAITTIESAIEKLPEEARKKIEPLLARSKKTFRGVEYDCLGCKRCYPALWLNELFKTYPELEHVGESCGTENIFSKEKGKWPPLPGDYNILAVQAPVAICALSDVSIKETVTEQAGKEVAIVGTLQTENLGIERLIQNVIANPNIRFLLVCGKDSKHLVGHYPGQSLVALARSGLDGHRRIIGANGKRPVIRNISTETVDHFRQTVEVVDMVGNDDPEAVLRKTLECAKRYPGSAEPFECDRQVKRIKGYIPERMSPDPAGYFVVFAERDRGAIMVEHYSNKGILDVVITGEKPAEIFFPIIDKGLVSRLDHAAYLGRELARAEAAIQCESEYVQDAAPELELSVNNKKRACTCPSDDKEKN